MKERMDPKIRKELKEKMLYLFGETMKPLSKDLQILLADDLITAFENRFKVLNSAQTQPYFCINTASEIENQLF